jgi:hypothetical protein
MPRCIAPRARIVPELDWVMHQAFARDDRPRQMQIKLFVMVKMGECLTAKAKCGKAILATGEWLFIHAELCKAHDELFA